MPASPDRRARLQRARLYLVCPARPGGRDVGPLLRAALGGGVDVVQLRDKEAGDAELVDAADDFRAACREHGALFVLNDRPDLAAECGADGVHLGQDDVPVPEARALVGEGLLIGLSTHTPEQVDAAPPEADYLGVGPVHTTPTKPGRPAVGLDLVRHAAAHARVPFFAIGGIDPGNVDAVVAAGASRVAVVRAVVEAGDPSAAARALRAAAERQPLPEATGASRGPA